MFFHCLFSIGYQSFLTTCGSCLEVVSKFEWRATYYGSMRAKLILAPLRMTKWVWHSVNWYRMLFVQTSTPPLSMHQKFIEHGRCCMETNQLLCKSDVELEDNFIESPVFALLRNSDLSSILYVSFYTLLTEAFLRNTVLPIAHRLWLLGHWILMEPELISLFLYLDSLWRAYSWVGWGSACSLSTDHCVQVSFHNCQFAFVEMFLSGVLYIRMENST